MNREKIFSALSIVLALASAVIGLLNRDGIGIMMSVLALCFAVLSAIYASNNSRFSLLTSLIVIICTASMATITSYELLVDDGYLSNNQWMYLSAAISALEIIPLIMMFYFTVASIFKASYNWVIVAGLATFLGMGMTVLCYVMLYLIQRNDIDTDVITNANIVIGLMVNLVSFVLFSIILGHVFKKRRYIITERGVEVVQ